MDPVVHFEMPAENRERVAAFYSGAFGWQTQMFGEEMGNYVLASTTETGQDGRPTTPGAINGGFFPRDVDQSGKTRLVISVEDIRASMKKVADAGGKVLGEPMDIPGIGQFVIFHDTEGNQVSMLQPAPMG